MIADHTRMQGDLRRAVATAHLPPPPPAMSSDQAMLLSGLQGLRGADFDEAYLRQQEPVHAQALAVVDSFAHAGADPTLQDAARAARPVIAAHLKQAQQPRSQIGGR